MADLLTFDEAIEHSAQFKKRHLLLGNGSQHCLSSENLHIRLSV